MNNPVIDRSARPTSEERLVLGRRIALSFGIDQFTPRLAAINTPPATLDDVATLITTQASSRTWDQILQATPNEIAGNGVPAVILDTAVENGYTRQSFGERIATITRDYFRELEQRPATEPEPYPNGTYCRVVVDNPQASPLVIDDVVRVFNSSPRPGETDPGMSIGYEVSHVEDANHMAVTSGGWLVRHAQIEPLPPFMPDDEAITVTNSRYGTSVPEGARVKVVRGPDHDGDYYCLQILPNGESGASGYFTRGMLGPVSARQGQAMEDRAAVEALTEAVVEEQPEVRALRETLRHRDQRISELVTWQQQARTDMREFSTLLMEEADRRSWCSEYDDIVEKGNDLMRVLEAEVRSQEVDCEAEIEAEVTVELNGWSFSGSMTMTISYTGDPENDPADNDSITDYTVEQYVADALGISYRCVSVDSWDVESYDRV